jgi:hypothetical protein
VVVVVVGVPLKTAAAVGVELEDMFSKEDEECCWCGSSPISISSNR